LDNRIHFRLHNGAVCPTRHTIARAKLDVYGLLLRHSVISLFLFQWDGP
jgi:hypothetical protein